MGQKDTQQCFDATDCFIGEEIYWKDTSIFAKILLEETLLMSPGRGTNLGSQAARLQSKRCYSGTNSVLTKLYLNSYLVELEYKQILEFFKLWQNRESTTFFLLLERLCQGLSRNIPSSQ